MASHDKRVVETGGGVCGGCSRAYPPREPAGQAAGKRDTLMLENELLSSMRLSCGNQHIISSNGPQGRRVNFCPPCFEA